MRTMILSENMYVPALGWRLGEYQALLRLDTWIKDRTMPLICIPEVGFDFAEEKLKTTVNDHVLPFVKQYSKKWGARPAWVALHDNISVGRMDNGSHVFDYIFDDLRQYHAHAAPAVSLGSDSDTVAAAARAIGRDGHGAGIRVRLKDLMDREPGKKVIKLANELSLPLEEADLIIDLRAPNFEPYQTFAKLLIATLDRFDDLSIFRNMVLISTAFPERIARGIDEIPRHDWLFYKNLLATLPNGMRRPVYGDYTVVHPEFTAMDMRMIKPASKIVYTTAETWATCKGNAFRDNREQMHDHCETIVNNHKFQFRGPGFSYGDDYIARCAKRLEGPSNLTLWKCITINHHITTAVDNLARMYAPS